MENKLEERKEKFKNILMNNKNYLIYLILFIIILVGFVIRISPIQNLQGKMLSMDDPYIFLRYSKYIAEHGELMKVDPLRYYPLGIAPIKVGPVVAYVIAYIYWIIHAFKQSFNIYDANIIYAPIFFVLLAFVFYKLVAKLFNYKVGLLATAFLVVVPPFIYRTMAGFNDKEPFGMLFMFLSFYFYILGLHNENKKLSLLYGVLAGLSTAIMGLGWGGVGFLLLIIPTFALIELFLNKFTQSDAYTYLAWVLSYILVLLRYGDRYGGVKGILGLYLFDYTLFVFFIVLAHIIFFRYNLLGIKDKIKDKLPEGIFSTIISILFVVIVGSLVLGPVFTFGQAYHIVDDFLIHPIGTARFQLTVAENQQPAFGTWRGEFSIQYFLFFFIGSMVLYYNLIKPIQKHKKKLMALYILFITGFIFSRYGGDSIFNGSSVTSKFVYGGSLALFVLGWAAFYLYCYYRDKETFNEILKLDKNTILVFVWFIFMIVGARTAIRLLFTFVPVTAVIAAYFIYYFYERRDELKGYALFSLFFVFVTSYLALFSDYMADKIFVNFIISGILSWAVLLGLNSTKLEAKTYKIVGIVLLIVLLFSPLARGSLFTFTRDSYLQTAHTGSGYTPTYQAAMQWIRENTPKDAVFAHWWDYGYLIQEEGQRATVGDPGNQYGYWNHLVGRYVLTAQNDIEALEFEKAHNVSYVFIVDDDIGKYGAYSSIGGDENNDRSSWIQVFGLDPKQTFETRDSTMLVFAGGFPLDEDFVYNGVLYPRGSSTVVGVLVPSKIDNGTTTFNQPEIILIYAGKQERIPLNCLYVDLTNDGKDNGRILESNTGYNGCFRIMPAINADGNGNIIGAGLFISERVKRTFMANYYLLGKKSSNFELVYQDDTPLAIFRGTIIGPIKIWKVHYPDGIKFRPEYLNTTWPSPKLYQI